MKWNEFEIKNFKGINEAQNAAINEFANLQNLNFSGKTGTLQSRKGIVELLQAPAHSGLTNVTNLGWDTFLADGKEVNVYVQKGTITRLGTVASITTLNIPVISIKRGDNDWEWLNKTILTHITAITDTTVTLYGYSSDSLIVGDYKDWRIYNLTKDEWFAIAPISATGVTALPMVTLSNDWDINDTVILTQSYIPYTSLDEIYAASVSDVVFHHVQDGLRIGFGGQLNRIGLSVVYIKRTLDTIITADNVKNIKNLNNIYLCTFNGYMDADAIDVDIYGFTPSPSIEGHNFPIAVDCGTAVFYAITAIMDGYQEFVVKKGVLTHVLSVLDTQFTVTPIIKAGLLHKRITGINVYVALSNPNDNKSRATPYKLVLDYPLTALTIGKYSWGYVHPVYLSQFNHDYGLELTTSEVSGDGELTTEGGIGVIVQYNNWNESIDIQNAIGHTVTTDYMTGWDQAISLPGRTYYINPYIDKRYTDKIFMSVIGEGFQTHDIVSPQEYLELPLKSGEAITGAEPLPNYDLLVFTNKRVMRINTYTGQVTDVNNAAGAVSRQGIVNYGDMIGFPSQNKIFITNGITFQSISDNIGSAYKLISDKSLIIAAKNPENSGYIFFDGSETEYSFDPKYGWMRNAISQFTSQTALPKKYVTDVNGLIRFLGSDGNIYIQTETTNSEEWVIESIELNVNNMGENLRYNDRLVIGGIWIDGDIPYTYYLEITTDNTFNDFSQITNGNIQDKQFIPFRKPIVTSKFKFRLSGYLDDGDNKTIIRGLGIFWKVLSRGKYGKKYSIVSGGAQ